MKKILLLCCLLVVNLSVANFTLNKVQYQYFCKVAELQGAGKNRESLELCNKLIALLPKNLNGFKRETPELTAADGWILRGSVYLSLKMNQQAINDFTSIINIDPNNALAYEFRAMAYGAAGNVNNMVADFQKAANLGNKYARDMLKSLGKFNI